MTTDQEIFKAFSPLYDDIDASASFPNVKPLLAHYTSLTALERIMATNELWFSNPLFMNDLEELRFGILQGIQLFLNNEAIRTACSTKERFDKLVDAFNHYANVFSNDTALDVYVFCLSLHDRENTDGLLSMWRGYGSNGNGTAIVFDTSKINAVPSSPLVIAPVEYSSSEKRRQWLRDCLAKFAELLKRHSLPDEKLHIAAQAIFTRLKIFALFTKHHGFAEEKEWRVVYLKEMDSEKKLEPMCHYAIGRRGLEPKLKLKIEPIEGLLADDLSLGKIVHQIILGPTVSHPMVKATVLRMLDRLNKSELKDRVVASTIPFRATWS